MLTCAPVPTLEELPPLLVSSTAVALGLVFGSFSNVVIYRWPRGQSVAFPASRCTHCQTPIKGYHNVPVLGWLLLRGRAPCCGQRISPRYPLVEGIGGLLAWAIVEALIFPLAGETPWWQVVLLFGAYLALGLGLVAAAFIDLDSMLLPDEITLGGAALGVVSTFLRPEHTWSEALLGAAVGFVMVWLPFDWLYSKLRGHPGMGLGDAKLVMLAGAWFGVPGAVFALLGGAVQGTLVALVLLLVHGKLEEPELVVEERRQLAEQLAQAEEHEREALEAELALDPLARPPEPGLAKARLAFGPFLILAILEYLLFEPALLRACSEFLGV